MPVDERSGPRPAYHLTHSQAEVDALFNTVRQRFGENWLAQQANTTVGGLWIRRDPSATSQLVILGAALEWAASAHPSWLDRHMRTLKSRDANERRGAMLELLGMHLLHGSGTGVAPTARGFPGYDAIVSFADGARLAVSLKNYGRSVHERRFATEAARAENALLAAMRSHGRHALVLNAWATAYPGERDWKDLRAGISEIVADGNSAKGVWARGPWVVRLLDPPDTMQPVSSNHVSHQMLIAAPFHPNERKNLLDKLDDAAANARKHALIGSDLARAVLVRVPETISAEACVKWSEAYLEDHPDGPVDLVAVYQVANVTDGEETHMQHAFVPRAAASFVGWLASGRVLAAHLEVGTVGLTAGRLHMTGTPHGSMDEAYVYQRGTWHRLASAQPDGAIRGDLGNPAPGINVRSVVRMPQGEFVIEGLFPPDGDVTLYD